MVLILIVVGCDSGAIDDAPPETPQEAYVKIRSSLTVETYDEILADIALELPGFGGFYEDESGEVAIVMQVSAR